MHGSDMAGEKQSSSARRVVRVVKSREHFHVWFCRDGKRHTLAGVTVSLAEDARRYGQDLVGELIDKVLRMADRQLLTG
jgi:hypothetical protein